MKKLDENSRTEPSAGTFPRLHLLDELRGFLIVCMVFYHAFYTMAEIFSSGIGTWLLKFFMPVEPFFAGGFILISGISCRLSRSNVKRGLRLLIIALLLTAATLLLRLFGIEQVIWFGILHMLSVSMLLFGLMKPLLDKLPAVAGIIICAVLFLLTFRIGQGELGLPGMYFSIPKALTDLPFLYPIGLHDSQFYSADYFPLFPWLFVFIAGAYIGKFTKSGRFPAFFGRSHCKPLSLVGRHAIVIYILHQPVIYGVCSLIFWIIS